MKMRIYLLQMELFEFFQMQRALIVFIVVFSLFSIEASAQCDTPTDTVTTVGLSYTDYTWAIDGITYSSSTHQEVLDDDCILQILNLTIYDTQTMSEIVSTDCDYYWDKEGTTYDASGDYTTSVTDANGKVTEYQLHLTVGGDLLPTPGSVNCSTPQWYPMGSAVGDFEVRTLDIDGSGTMVAVGNYNEGDSQEGIVKVYQWTGTDWTQMGETLRGNLSTVSDFGIAVSLSRNGKYLAVGNAPTGYYGEVNVYEWTGTIWELRGSTIHGIDSNDELGSALDLSNDGSILAIGAVSSNRVHNEVGEVRVYQWTGSDWHQMGDNLYNFISTETLHNNGYSIAVSGDGQRVIYGAPFSSPVISWSGTKVSSGGLFIVMDWNGTEWVEAERREGYRNNMTVGRSVSLSESGEVYSGGGDLDNSNRGIVFINYRSVAGPTPGSQRFGASVDLNQAGDRIVIGSPQNSDVGELAAGMVRTYEFDGSNWAQLGQDILGQNALEFFGMTVRMNGDGNVIAVSPYQSGDVIYNGANIYYLGCADETPTCTSTVIWAEGAWSNGSGPDTEDLAIINDDLTIGSGASLTIGELVVNEGHTVTVSDGSALDVIGDVTIDGALTVGSGGTLLTYDGNKFIGEATFIRNTRYADGRYSFVSAPVPNMVGRELGPVVYGYGEHLAYGDDGLDRWYDYTNYGVNKGSGFAVAGQKTITASGIPTVGTLHRYNLSYTQDATTTSDNWGWHIMGNPYSAAIDVEKFLDYNSSSINGFIALWDDPGSNTGRGSDADYLIANAIGSVAGPNGGDFNGYIGVMQGFFVQTLSNRVTVTFTEDMRVSGNNSDANYFRTAKNEIKKLKVIMTDEEGHYSETLIGFPDDATDGVDTRYDATKFKTGKSHNIYSVINGLPYAIQGLPMSPEMRVPLGIDREESGRVTIYLEGLDALGSYGIALRDNITGQSYDLSEKVILDAIAGTSTDRYELVLTVEVLSEESLTHSLILSVKDENILLHYTNEREISGALLYDMMGHLIDSQTVPATQVSLKRPEKKGVYILRSMTRNGQIDVRKIMIQ